MFKQELRQCYEKFDGFLRLNPIII